MPSLQAMQADDPVALRRYHTFYLVVFAFTNR